MFGQEKMMYISEEEKVVIQLGQFTDWYLVK